MVTWSTSISLIMAINVISAQQKLYAKIGCMYWETSTCTELQLHVYIDSQWSQSYNDDESSKKHLSKGYESTHQKVMRSMAITFRLASAFDQLFMPVILFYPGGCSGVLPLGTKCGDPTNHLRSDRPKERERGDGGRASLSSTVLSLY